MQLPAEIDFLKDDDASPERMNGAMEFIYSMFLTVAGLKPQYETQIAQIEAIGLQRLTDVLLPIFVNAQNIEAQLEGIQAAWLGGNALDDLQEALLASISSAITTAVGELAPRLDDLETFQASMAARFQRIADEAWFDNHG